MSTLPPVPTPSATSFTMTPLSPQPVVITDINMSIGAMCLFMIKWMIAAIPAAIILWVLLLIVGAIIAVVFGGVLHGLLGQYPGRF
ncbi:hypothetical protein [Granulicella sp. dw_53]|uniref:hypothetical protein n=1 Tax=Granulicella sp. dw_53 TaxID=2719792 RepID=UPI001BD4298D|nr:hypothetical protein [Granulicella sp. dw_53]